MASDHRVILKYLAGGIGTECEPLTWPGVIVPGATSQTLEQLVIENASPYTIFSRCEQP